MEIITSFIPITVFAAIILFIAKESLEIVRRKRADSRKVRAIKTMVAREIELNNWAIKSIRAILDTIMYGLEQNPPRVISIDFVKSGSVRFKSRSTDKREFTGRPVPQVHSETMSKYMMDVATLDRRLFEMLRSAYDATTDINHVRESLISLVRNEDPDISSTIRGFLDYARDELASCHDDLALLYKACTGNELDESRIRLR